MKPVEYPLQDIKVPFRFEIREKRVLKDTEVGESGVKRARISEDDTEEWNDEELLPLSPIASPGLEENGINSTTFSSRELVSTINSQLNSVSYKNLVYKMMSKLKREDLADFSTVIMDSLKRDFIKSLPSELAIKILLKLSYKDIINCLQVSKKWNKLIVSSPEIWKSLLISENFVSSDSFDKYASKLLKKYPNVSNKEDCYYIDFSKNRNYLHNWYNKNFKPQRYTLKGHVTSVVTCLQFEDDYIISGADDKIIRVYSAKNKKLINNLTGHEGGVWALKYVEDGIIVSGSTDRTVRIWDIELGCCTHVFKGHTSTVRCLEIVEYKDVKYIITGSRDNTLHVWKLPKPDFQKRAKRKSAEDMAAKLDDDECFPYLYNTPEENPYFVGVLRGHMASVRTLSGHGNIVISGSYDNSLMVWDIAQMKCLYVLTGHTDRIYSTVYDYKRCRCISASMDATIRVWDLKDIWKNGTCARIMNAMTPCTNIMGSMLILHGHTALVGLLKLSDRFLVSAAADGSLRGWNADSYGRKFIYSHANMSAITTFDVNDNLLVSGSETQFNIYNLRTGGMIHPNLLCDADQIWSVKFKENILAVAVERNSSSFIEIFDFNEMESSQSNETQPAE